jgi:hypothetical protein
MLSDMYIKSCFVASSVCVQTLIYPVYMRYISCEVKISCLPIRKYFVISQKTFLIYRAGFFIYRVYNGI